MDKALERRKGDWLAEGLGAVALGAGCAGAALMLVPGLAALAGVAGAAAGWLIVRAVPSAPALPLAAFEPAAVDIEAPVTEPQGHPHLRLVNSSDTERSFLGDAAAIPPDATDALHAALDDIRRLLRKR